MKENSAKVLMAAVCIARGTSFLFSKTLMESMHPMSVMGVRFTLAFIILACIFNKKIRKIDKSSLKGGLLLGCLYTVCMTFEMYGLRLIDTGTSAFIENMAIVIVPLYAAVLTRRPPALKTMICAVIAVAGVGCLSLTQENSAGGFNMGIVLAILAALTFAACVMVTDRVSRQGDPVTIGMIQLGTMGVITLVMSLCMGTFSVPQTAGQWAMIGCLVVVCSCFGFTFQPVAQKYITAETAAMFTVVNPLACFVLGIIAADEDHGPVKIIGCFLILIAIVIYNIRSENRKSAETAGNSCRI